MKVTEKLTQENRILELAQERGTLGFYVYELITPRPQGLGIAQYNARIKGLRKRGYTIKNITPGYFRLLDSSFKEEKPQEEAIKSQINATFYTDSEGREYAKVL